MHGTQTSGRIQRNRLCALCPFPFGFPSGVGPHREAFRDFGAPFYRETPATGFPSAAAWPLQTFGTVVSRVIARNGKNTTVTPKFFGRHTERTSRNTLLFLIFFRLD